MYNNTVFPGQISAKPHFVIRVVVSQYFQSRSRTGIQHFDWPFWKVGTDTCISTSFWFPACNIVIMNSVWNSLVAFLFQSSAAEATSAAGETVAGGGSDSGFRLSTILKPVLGWQHDLATALFTLLVGTLSAVLLAFLVFIPFCITSQKLATVISRPPPVGAEGEEGAEGAAQPESSRVSCAGADGCDCAVSDPPASSHSVSSHSVSSSSQETCVHKPTTCPI